MPFNSYPLELWTLDSEQLFFDNIFFEGLYALKIERSEGWVLDIQQETFTLLTINNFNMLETEGLVDISLILGNLVDVYLAGSLAVYNVWYRAAHTNLLMFWMIFVYRFVNKIQYFLLLLSFLEFVSIFVRTVTLPNRITINLFTGSLIMTIVGSGYSVT